MDAHYERTVEMIAGLESSVEKLNIFVTEAIKHMSDLGVDQLKVVYQTQIAPNTRNPYLASPKRSLYKITNALIMEAQEKGEIREDIKSGELALILINCFRGQLYHWCLKNGSFDLIDSCEKLNRLIIDSLTV